jgi:hypothetical protein
MRPQPVYVIPNPGSPEAVEAGCSCPVLDNHHGKGRPYKDSVEFVMNFDCPIHGPAALATWESKVE